jgi:hypothetical protein
MPAGGHKGWVNPQQKDRGSLAAVLAFVLVYGHLPSSDLSLSQNVSRAIISRLLTKIPKVPFPYKRDFG